MTIFQTFQDAEATIKTTISNISNNYISAIKQILPTLKNAATNTQLSKNDSNRFNNVYIEASDHLHNLVQLKIELDTISNESDSLVLEISTEIIANAMKFFQQLPETLNNSELFKVPIININHPTKPVHQ